MPARTQFALILCGLIALGSIAVGLDLVLVRGCEMGDGCAGADVAWVIGLPLIVLGLAMLAGLAFGWSRAPGFTGQAACTVWACALLAAAGGVGGAANAFGIALGALAIAMGAMSVWVPR